MRVVIGNLPIQMYTEATIEVPDDTIVEDLDLAISKAIEDGSITDIEPVDSSRYYPLEDHIDSRALEEWDFQVLDGGPEASS